MKFSQTIAAIIILLSSASSTVFSHPSSGIVVNPQGEVFFVHSTRGVAKIDPHTKPSGKLTYIHESTGGHWLCLDSQGHFSRTQPRRFLRITPDGATPAIIFADGGAPIAVGADGNFYYGSGWEGAHDHDPGADTVSRLSRDGSVSHFAPTLKAELAGQRAGVTGLAAAPDGALYVSSSVAILKVAMDGSIKTIVERPTLNDCDGTPPPDGLPGFRGIDVTTNGTIYAAATGCRAVVKINPDGTVETILKSEPPWSPTAVTAHQQDLYILEWTNPNDGPDSGWRPRVRKLDKTGAVTTLVTIAENVKVPRR